MLRLIIHSAKFPVNQSHQQLLLLPADKVIDNSKFVRRERSGECFQHDFCEPDFNSRKKFAKESNEQIAAKAYPTNVAAERLRCRVEAQSACA